MEIGVDNRLVTPSGKTRFRVKDTYTVYADGIVRVESALSPLSKLMPMLPRVGKTVEMRPEFSDIVYYGAGPYESYPDFKAQSRPGVYKTGVDDLGDKYIRPQECGNRTDVRYAAVMNQKGEGLMFLADTALLNFGGKRYTDSALEGFKHREDIVNDDKAIYYSVDGYMLGIGSNSCGPLTMKEYRLNTNRTYTYSFKIVPFTELKEVTDKFDEESDE